TRDPRERFHPMETIPWGDPRVIRSASDPVRRADVIVTGAVQPYRDPGFLRRNRRVEVRPDGLACELPRSTGRLPTTESEAPPTPRVGRRQAAPYVVERREGPGRDRRARAPLANSAGPVLGVNALSCG